MTKQELIKERRSQDWRTELRKAHPNKERIAYERTKMSELPIAERITSFHEEVSLGYTREEAMAEARRCLDCPNPGCVEGCPVGIHIPSFIKLIEKGEMLEAVGIIRETSSLPAVCGRVCPQEKQCESQCIYTLSLKKEAVSIGNLERYVADYERIHRDHSIKSKRSEKPKLGRIAVVGSGPAGLSFATDMAKWGYDVTVYEAESQLGGVLRYGIPEFCLPNSIIEDELDKMRDLGVTFQTDTIVGKTITYEELKAQGIDGIFIATGVGVANYMGIPGEDLKGVYTASEYLAKYNLMSPEELAEALPSLRGKRVAVIGGGNTAIDAVRTAIRLDAKQATIVYRRSEEEMPARAEEIKHAREEGTEFLNLHNPVEYLGDESGHVTAMRLERMEWEHRTRVADVVLSPLGRSSQSPSMRSSSVSATPQVPWSLSQCLSWRSTSGAISSWTRVRRPRCPTSMQVVISSAVPPLSSSPWETVAEQLRQCTRSSLVVSRRERLYRASFHSSSY